MNSIACEIGAVFLLAAMLMLAAHMDSFRGA